MSDFFVLRTKKDHSAQTEWSESYAVKTGRCRPPNKFHLESSDLVCLAVQIARTNPDAACACGQGFAFCAICQCWHDDRTAEPPEPRGRARQPAWCTADTPISRSSGFRR